MKYHQIILLKNGKEALLRNGETSDGQAVYDNYNRVHAETDYLLAYSDENNYDPEQEGQFLEEMTDSPNQIMLLAEIDGTIAGTAVIEAVGRKDKVKHRAEFGISILKEYWGLGLGKALADACIQCAREAGYEQLELNAVADNERALSLYRSLGFSEFGRNPKGFKLRTGVYQELIYMRLSLYPDSPLPPPQDEENGHDRDLREIKQGAKHVRTVSTESGRSLVPGEVPWR